MMHATTALRVLTAPRARHAPRGGRGRRAPSSSSSSPSSSSSSPDASPVLSPPVHRHHAHGALGFLAIVDGLSPMGEGHRQQHQTATSSSPLLSAERDRARAERPHVGMGTQEGVANARERSYAGSHTHEPNLVRDVAGAGDRDGCDNEYGDPNSDDDDDDNNDNSNERDGDPHNRVNDAKAPSNNSHHYGHPRDLPGERPGSQQSADRQRRHDAQRERHSGARPARVVDHRTSAKPRDPRSTHAPKGLRPPTETAPTILAMQQTAPPDRGPRASSAVPMLPLCETADDAQAVRALSGDKRYAVVRRLGSGASSTVFLACDRLRSNALVAIKVVSDSKVSRSEILAGVCLGRHPTMAAMIDWFSARDHYFLVFEHIDGPDLQVLWAGLPATRDFFDEFAFRRVFLCVLDAVAHCHEHGVVHRDIKMENVVMRDDGGSACLVDFGFAFFVHPPRASRSMDARHTDKFSRHQRESASLPSQGPAADQRNQRSRPLPSVATPRLRYETDSDAAEGRLDHRAGSIESRASGRDQRRGLDCIYRRNRDGMLVAMRMDTPDVLDSTNAFVGTEEYCAPELTLGALIEPADLFATDVYSLGVLLHVALTDRFPQRPDFVEFLIATRYRLQHAHHPMDPREALADPRLMAEINRRGALDLAAMPSTTHTPLSAQVRDLITRMLRPVPAERITLAQVQGHPWVMAGRRCY